jgi:uncharacterized protein YjbI with pentapeptide repeats
MSDRFFDSLNYDKQDYSVNYLDKGIYECCTFTSCNFSESDLTGISFLECTFKACNLSLSKISKTAFIDCKFTECKMLGMRFDSCNQSGFSLSPNACILNHSSFYKTALKKTNFSDCQLQEVDFTDCDLSGSVFETCDLRLALFDNTNLEKVDFRTAVNYSINPAKNRIKKARFSISGIAGLLDSYDIDIE